MKEDRWSHENNLQITFLRISMQCHEYFDSCRQCAIVCVERIESVWKL